MVSGHRLVQAGGVAGDLAPLVKKAGTHADAGLIFARVAA
jgi:hypothetical protein